MGLWHKCLSLLKFLFSMIVLTYFVALVAFYITYLISALIFGRIFISIRRYFSSDPFADLEGFPLLYTVGLTTYASFTSVFILIFIWFNYQPNWYILSPLMVMFWFYFAPALYRPHFSGGAAHWGMLLGAITFLATTAQLK
jgi:hypothetical protein